MKIDLNPWKIFFILFTALNGWFIGVGMQVRLQMCDPAKPEEYPYLIIAASIIALLFCIRGVLREKTPASPGR